MADREIGRKLLKTLTVAIWVGVWCSIGNCRVSNKDCDKAIITAKWEQRRWTEQQRVAYLQSECRDAREAKAIATLAIGGLGAYHLLIFWVRWLLKPKTDIPASNP